MSTEFHSPEGYTEFVTKLVSNYSMENFKTKLGTMGLGLAGEAGEIAALVKFPDHTLSCYWTEEDNRRVIDELSDVCWYVAFGSRHVLQIDFGSLYARGSVDPLDRSVDPAMALRTKHVQLTKACCGIADQVKKLLYHGKEFNDQVRTNLIERTQTVMTIVATLAREVCGASVDDLIVHNVAKLSERYKSLTFSTAESLAKEARGEE